MTRSCSNEMADATPILTTRCWPLGIRLHENPFCAHVLDLDGGTTNVVPCGDGGFIVSWETLHIVAFDLEYLWAETWLT